MEAHIQQVCHSSYFHLRNIGKVRPFLTTEAAATLVHSLVATRIDYANSLLYGLPDYSLAKLQKVLNTAARIVSCCNRFEPITPVLRELHWLKVRERIMYKLLVLTYKALNGKAPSYLQELVNVYVPARPLRSQNTVTLVIPKARLKRYGDRAFMVAAPTIWNTIPASIRSSTSLDIFRSRTKTYLFGLQ